MDNFDDAKYAAEGLFSGEAAQNDPPAQETQAVGNDGGEAGDGQPQAGESERHLPSDDTAAQRGPAASEQSAGYAAQQAQMQQFQQLQQQVAAMQEQNAQLQSLVNELSQKNEEHVIEDAVEMPVLDIGELGFADEDTLRHAQTEYAQKMAEYVKGSAMKELQPFIEEAQRGKAEKEKQELIDVLCQVPELAGIKEMLPQMERIMANNPGVFADSVPLDERLVAAYAMTQGVNAMNTPKERKELTTDELMALYNKNSDFQDAVERQRLAALKGSQQVPPLSASSGAVNAPINIPDKPRSFDEASERARNMFGL